MGLFRRLLGASRSTPSQTARSTILIEGDDDLEVVGESFYQEALQSLVGNGGQRVRIPVHAVLSAESNNSYDANAISVWIGGRQVGHLSREAAQALRPGLLALERRHDAAIALPGVVTGGGDGRPNYGVFLRFNAAEFGVATPERSTASARSGREVRVRTGFTNAIADDAANDAYDLTWQSRMPDDTLKAIAYLRAQLLTESEPVSRHFAFATLADRLYGARDEFGSALAEFDDVCRSHDAEMGRIRPALIKTFGGLPLLEVYKQSAIRHQKAHDWANALWWAQRGLEVYGTDAINDEVVSDLTRRIANYSSKLDPPGQPQRPLRLPSTDGPTETLVCRTCGLTFERVRTRGRKPVQCPTCREPAGRIPASAE